MSIENINGYKSVKYDNTYLEELNVDSFSFIVHKNDTCVADCLRSGTLFEKFIVTFVKQFINPKGNILDLGANIGTHSIIYSNYTSGKVYSFEPQKTVFDILKKNIELNNCPNIIPYNFGASNVNKEFYMLANYEKKDNHGAFSINESLDEKSGLKVECKIIDELDIQDVCYVKIDVEGHEYQALLGMKKLLERYHPVIMIEIHDSSLTKNETIIFLIELGYYKHLKLSHCDYLFINQKTLIDLQP
jgi:FkbM family methyltransferase